MAVSPASPGATGARLIARVLRIIARTLSLLLLALLLFDWIEAGPGPFSRTPHHDDIEEWWATALMIVAGVSLLVAWRWELLGGAVAAAGMALFTLIGLVAASDSEVTTARLFAAIVFGLPGVFFLLTGFAARYADRSRRLSPLAAAGTPTPPRPVGP